jgi:hypothetical protein
MMTKSKTNLGEYNTTFRGREEDRPASTVAYVEGIASTVAPFQ